MAVNARKPFAPVAAPILQAHSTHLLCFFVFSLHSGRLSAPYTPQTQEPALRLVSRRRIGGKIIKILQLWVRSECGYLGLRVHKQQAYQC